MNRDVSTYVTGVQVSNRGMIVNLWTEMSEDFSHFVPSAAALIINGEKNRTQSQVIELINRPNRGKITFNVRWQNEVIILAQFDEKTGGPSPSVVESPQSGGSPEAKG